MRGYGDESYTVTVPKTTCGKEWQPNDGLVNVVSGRWPYHFVNSAPPSWEAEDDPGIHPCCEGHAEGRLVRHARARL